jgi:hypothetical protein
MRPTFAQGRKAAISKLLKLRRQAQKDKEPRVVLRIQGILMSERRSLAGSVSGGRNGRYLTRLSESEWIRQAS